MKREHKTLWTVLIVLALAVIWGNSLLPPQKSWQISDAIQKFLACFTPVDSPDAEAGGFWGVVVRKLAHVIEFFALGALLRLRLGGGQKNRWLAPLAGLAAALIDETIQYYTGRTSLVLDVWIDFFGVIAGVLLVTCVSSMKAQGGAGKRNAR